MSNKLRDNLPDWFDVSRYESTENMSPSEWLLNIEIRNSLSLYNSRNDLGEYEYNVTDEMLISQFIHGQNALVGKVKPMKSKNDNSFNMGSVMRLYPEFVGAIYSDMLSSIPEQWKPYVKDLRFPPENEKEAYDEFNEKPFEYYLHKKHDKSYSDVTDGHCFIGLSIDLSSPDDQIIEDIKSILSEYRDMLSVPKIKTFSNAFFSSLSESNVLAYYDLIEWAKYKQLDFTHQEIGVLVFPDDYDINLESKIRRTVKPKYDLLQRDTFVSALNNYIYSSS